LGFYNLVHENICQYISGGTRSKLNQNELRRIQIPFPENGEQRRIATVLDTVDETITKTEAVIAKLRQIRAGLLHDLLTLGLDDHGQLRDPVAHSEQFQDSALGVIPVGWVFGAIGDFIDLTVGPAFESDRFSKGEQGVRLLRGVNVTQGHVRWGDDITERWPQLTPDLAIYRMEVGDVVIGMDGALVGRNVASLTSADVPSILVQRVARIRGLPRLRSAYAYLLLTIPVFLRHVDTRKTHTAIPHITAGDIREYRVIIPKLDEQEEILRVVDAADTEITTMQVELTKLLSLKSGLMTDLLTGRVRVPNASGPGP
jgi:type I restriction enzyme, S subunit